MTMVKRWSDLTWGLAISYVFIVAVAFLLIMAFGPSLPLKWRFFVMAAYFAMVGGLGWIAKICPRE